MQILKSAFFRYSVNFSSLAKKFPRFQQQSNKNTLFLKVHFLPKNSILTQKKKKKNSSENSDILDIFEFFAPKFEKKKKILEYLIIEFSRFKKIVFQKFKFKLIFAWCLTYQSKKWRLGTVCVSRNSVLYVPREATPSESWDSPDSKLALLQHRLQIDYKTVATTSRFTTTSQTTEP